MKITVKNLNSCLSFFLLILVFLSCTPVMPAHWSRILIALSAILYFTMYFLLSKEMSFHKKYAIPFILSIIFLFYINIPFRPYDRFSPSIVWGLILLSLFFLPYSTIKKVKYNINKVFFCLSCAALFFLLLSLLSIDFPFLEVSLGERYNYKSYILSSVLINQYYFLGPLQAYRVSSIFAEPGHFGIFLCLNIALNYKQISKREKIIYMITVLFTLSAASYLLYLIVQIFCHEKKSKILWALLGVFLIVFISLPSDILDSFFLKKIESGLDTRSTNEFIEHYHRFSLNIKNFLLGLGRDIIEHIGYSSSDYKGFVMRYGLLGVIIYFFWLSSFPFQKKRNKFLVIVILFFIFLHRSWMIDYLIIYFFIFSCSKDTYERN